MNKTIDSLRIAQNIKCIRLLNHLTQEEMAEILFISERQVRRIEKNGTNSIELINQIANTFNISAMDILFQNGMS